MEKLESIQTDLFWIKTELAKNDAAHQHIIDLLSAHEFNSALGRSAAASAVVRAEKARAKQ